MVLLYLLINHKFVIDMRKILKTTIRASVFLSIFTTHAQIRPDCPGAGETIVWTSDIFNGFDTSKCDNDVEIIATTRNIKVKNYIKINSDRELIFKPTANHSIAILPAEKENNTQLPPDIEIQNGIGDRTEITGTFDETELKPPVTLTLYPNPAHSELKITSNKEILHYYVLDFHYNILLEGNSLPNNNLSVNSLLPGTYFLAIQTEEGVTSKFFIKN